MYFLLCSICFFSFGKAEWLDWVQNQDSTCLTLFLLQLSNHALFYLTVFLEIRIVGIDIKLYKMLEPESTLALLLNSNRPRARPIPNTTHSLHNHRVTPLNPINGNPRLEPIPHGSLPDLRVRIHPPRLHIRSTIPANINSNPCTSPFV